MKKHCNPYARRTDRPIPNRQSDFSAARKKRTNDDCPGLPLHPSKRKHCLASPKKANKGSKGNKRCKGNKRIKDDGAIAALNVVVATTLAYCNIDMIHEDFLILKMIARPNGKTMTT
jgi:hypothetical protein